MQEAERGGGSWRESPPEPSAESPGVAYRPPAGYRPEPRTNVKAILALVFGIVGVVALPFVGSVVAVVLGGLARKEISADPTQTGDGFALTGLILGWVMLGLLALALAVLVVVVLVAIVVVLVVFVVALIIHILVEEEGSPDFFPFNEASASRLLRAD